MPIGQTILKAIGNFTAGKAGDLVKNLTGLVDESKYSAEEKAAHELKVAEVVNAYNLAVMAEATKEAISEDENVTERWKADMGSDSWLSKNTRPIVMLSLLLFLFVVVICDSANITFDVKEGYISLLESLLLTTVVAYFGSRGVEKFQAIKEAKKK